MSGSSTAFGGRSPAMIAVGILLVAAIIAIITVPVVLTNASKQQQQQMAISTTSSSSGASTVSTTSSSSNNNNSDDNNNQVNVGSSPENTAAVMTATPGSNSVPETNAALDENLNNDETPTTLRPTPSPTTFSPTPDANRVAGVVESFTTAGGIDYYHCFADATPSPTQQHHIFLLHGASFDREVWMDRTGILEQFCATPGIRVSSLDLPVSTNYLGLQTVIDDVVSQQQQTGGATNGIPLKPVVLVTPSASGYSVVSWMMANNPESAWATIPNYIEVWVPVAPVALTSASDEQIAGSIVSAANIPVLAIYGEDDSGGVRLSQRLGRVAGDEAGGVVKVVGLEGGHPVYLRSPDEFVREILNFIAGL